MSKFIPVVMFILFCTATLPGQPKSLKDMAAEYFKEVKAVTAEHENLWNYNLYAPLLLVQPESREIFANSPDTAGVLKNDGMIFTGLLPANVNIANTSIRWNGVHWAMVMLPLSKEKNDRLNLLTHELFHTAQPSLGFKLSNPDNNHLDQKDGRIYLRLELEALQSALHANSPDEVKKHVTNALAFRMYRYALYQQAESTENQLELNEGLAEYTGVMMSGRNKQELQSHFSKSFDEFLKNPTFVRSFAYQTIPLYGCLLHNILEGWNKDITSGTDLTSYFIKKFTIQLPGDLKGAVTKTTDQYAGRLIIAEETERELKINKVITAYKKKFFEQPHLDIPLQHMNVSFDPRNIMPLEDKGTVYPNIRVTDDWGILTVTKGALMSPVWNNVTITAPKQIGKENITGDGWKLELKTGFVVEKENMSGNYLLKKR
jgi:hypothetical protein